MNTINPILKWWVTPKLPYHDVFELPFLKNKNIFGIVRHVISQWLAHPVKRRLARGYLKILQRYTDIKVIAVTGSAGKTTTIQMLASILNLSGKTVWSKEGVDSVYNIPNTILRIPWGAKFLILEMSVEYLGEMDFYLWLSRPDIGVITNIYPTHTLFFGDTGGVFREKSKLVNGLSKEGIAVLNNEDKFLTKLKGKAKTKTLWFGNDTHVMSSQEKFTSDFKTEFLLILDQNSRKKIKISLPVFGKQFIGNALAAAAVAYALRVDVDKIRNGLTNYDAPPHRMRVIKHASGAIIIDDSYNSSPRAAIEALSTLEELQGEKVIIFGDMLELGRWEEKYHRELGEYIGKAGVANLICVGHASEVTARTAARILGQERVLVVPNWKEAVKPAKKLLREGIIVLVKGSRSVGLDNLIARLS